MDGSTQTTLGARTRLDQAVASFGIQLPFPADWLTRAAAPEKGRKVGFAASIEEGDQIFL